MGYGYFRDATAIRITWCFAGIDSDEDIPRPNNGVDFLMDKYREKICEEFLLGVITDEEWDEFKAGLSMTLDRVEKFSFSYLPLAAAVLYIVKRQCPKCRKPCGLAEQFCDGQGKSLRS